MLCLARDWLDTHPARARLGTQLVLAEPRAKYGARSRPGSDWGRGSALFRVPAWLEALLNSLIDLTRGSGLVAGLEAQLDQLVSACLEAQLG